MRRRPYDVVIVGSGPAGLSAAHGLDGRGLSVLLLDENPHLGGQILRKMVRKQPGPKECDPDRAKRIGFDLADGVRSGSIQVMNRTRVLGVYPERVLCIEDSQNHAIEVQARFIVFATGAREKFLPFAGWTLPGVLSLGAAQVLIKSSGILPAAETLIAGSGPLPVVLAREILSSGGRVRAVLQEPSLEDQAKVLRFLHRQPRKLVEGAHALWKLLLSRIPLKQRTRILEARGRNQLEEVVTVRIDSEGRGIAGTETRLRTECLAVGYGFAPNIELPQLAGCKIAYSQAKGGWIVHVDDRLETSVENVYAAGEITGIAGAAKSLIEGQMAALDVLRKSGLLAEAPFAKQWEILYRERQHQIRFGEFLNGLCRIPPASYEALPDETVICRCEDVTMGEIRNQIRNGFSSPGAVKKATRCAMGYCQGRMCGPILHDILAATTGRPHTELPPLPVRTPVKPVALGALADLEAD